ncbi:PIN domain-containing protein [Campylobacter upsaliensis]
MKAYLIDAENVSPHNFFKNYKFKKEEKNIFYIVGNSHLHFNTRCLKILSKTKYEIFTFDHPSKDYADKIILTLLGILATKKKITDIYIISNDKIFENLEYMYEFFGKKIHLIHIQREEPFFLKHEKDIIKLLEKANSKSEFHTLLQKTYQKTATNIYRFIKTNRPELLKTLENV